MVTVDERHTIDHVFTVDLAGVALRLYDELNGNYRAVQRGMSLNGYSQVTYRQIYRFFERQGLPARGVGKHTVTIDDYAKEVVDAYYCVHGNARRAQALLARQDIDFSQSALRSLWQRKGLRSLGDSVTAEIKHMVLWELIPACSSSYAAVMKALRNGGIKQNSHWKNLFSKHKNGSFPSSQLTTIVLRQEEFTDKDFRRLEKYFNVCAGDVDIAGEEFGLPRSVVLYHWDDAEKPFDFKYVPGINYQLQPEEMQRRPSVDEIAALVHSALENSGQDAIAAWRTLQEGGHCSVSVQQVLRYAREVRRKENSKKD